jgi:hypothetical protein
LYHYAAAFRIISKRRKVKKKEKEERKERREKGIKI